MMPVLALAVLLLAPPCRGAAGEAAGDRGLRFYHQGDVHAAIRWFEDSIRKSSGDATAYLNAALLYRELGRPAKSLPLLQQAAKLRPRDPDVLSTLGWTALRAGKPSEAGEAFASALALDGDHTLALLGSARLELDADRPEGALRVLRRLLAVDKHQTLAHIYAARAYESLGDAERAAKAYQRAQQSDPTYTEVRSWLGDVYQRLGKVNQAWKQYTKILDVEPTHEEARRARARLERSLTKRREEILPPKRIRKPVKVVAAPGSGRMPVVRVAIGTSIAGNPTLKKAVAFGTDGPFEVIDPESRKRLRMGTPGDVWLVRRLPGPKPSYELVDGKQRRLARFSRAILIRPSGKKSRSLVFKGLKIADGTAWESEGDRQLKGAVEIRVKGDGLFLVNVLKLEDYLYGVINGEMPANFPHEALKAQAIIARNHALITKDVLKLHKEQGYDICDGQHCQVYTGLGQETKEGRKACDATRGLVLYWRNELAQTPYSANCGGHTQDSSEVRGWAMLPYLRGRLDSADPLAGPRSPWELDRWLKTRPKAYCDLPSLMHPSHFRWSRIVPAQDLAERVNKRQDIGRLRLVRILQRSRSGNVNRLEFRGSKGHLILNRENSIRSVLGLSSARSTMFLLETERGADGLPSEFYVYGGGWGHGVGLCQCGAAGRALAGQLADEILAHYYPGTRLKRLRY